MEIQWYPGQMAKARRLMRENLKHIDVVIEVLDARIPNSSRNPELQNFLSARPVVAVMTHQDLADEKATDDWQQALAGYYSRVTSINAKSGDGIKKLLQLLANFPRQAGREKRPLRLMVVGIPNVGKSSLINRMIGRSATVTGNKPGITKGKQWVRAGADLEILDTPGILMPKISSATQAFALAAVGAVKDEIMDIVQLALELADYLMVRMPENIKERYNFNECDKGPAAILEEVGRRRGCLLKGGEIDLQAAAFILVRDFREGRLGRITLEKAGECKCNGK